MQNRKEIYYVDSFLISKPLLSISKESIVEVEGTVAMTKEKIESVTQQTVEIQVQRLFLFAKAITPLPLLIQDASRPESVYAKQVIINVITLFLYSNTFFF